MSADAPSNQCYSFAESGNCRFGDRCRFAHGAGHPGVARQPRAPRAERDNTCYAFQSSGSCKFGDNCRFSHGGAAPAAAAASSGSSRPRRARGPASKSQQCYSFAESGSCQYGDECRFAHGENDSRDLVALKRRAAGVCYNWQQTGDCKFGETCRFAHENVPERAAATEAQ